MKQTCASDHYWEIRRGAVTLCHGPRETIPTPAQRKQLLADGYEVIVNGKGSKSQLKGEQNGRVH